MIEKFNNIYYLLIYIIHFFIPISTISTSGVAVSTSDVQPSPPEKQMIQNKKEQHK